MARAAEAGGGTAFADLVWNPVVVVEIEKRGADLLEHYRHAFDFWVRITGGHPRCVILPAANHGAYLTDSTPNEIGKNEFWYPVQTMNKTSTDSIATARHIP